MNQGKATVKLSQGHKHRGDSSNAGTPVKFFDPVLSALHAEMRSLFD